MEILGLAFVFVILIFGLMIFLRLGINSYEEKYSTTDEQVLASIISSMLKTTINCTERYKYSVTTLLKDCAESGRIICNGEISCKVANDTMVEILENTLLKFGESFHLNINTSTSSNNITRYFTERCMPTSAGIFYTQPFDVSGSTLNINLRICRR
ncbi:MAG: hypothetical protein ACMXX8_01970 [Candidatus Woesearchaeota archaeon]